MPTIIDSLIVTLGLDPRSFNQSQKQAVQSLQQLQTQSASINKLIHSGTNALNQPVQNANRGLQNLSTQAGRTGSAVAAGGHAAAAGINQIVAAGLAAYSTLKLVQGVLGSIKEATTRGAEAGRIALEIGGTTQWTDAFAKAANVATNVPTDAVKGEMAEFQKNMERWRRGEDVGGWLNQLNRAGLHLNQTDTQAEAMLKASDVLSKLTPTQAAERGQAMGLSQTQRFLRGGRAAVTEATGVQMSVAVTDRQTKAYQDLQTAINSTFAAYEGLVNKFMERNPELTKSIKWMDEFLRNLQSTPEGMKKVETGLTALSVAIGIFLTAVVAKFAFNSKLLLATPMGRLLWGSLLAYEGAAALGAVPANPIPEKKELDAGRGMIRSWYPWNWGKSKNKPAAEAKIPPLSSNVAPNASNVASGYSSPATAIAGAIISRNESKDQDVNNFMYDRPGARRMGPDGVERGYTAGGYHQMLDTNWIKYANQIGVDTTKYPRAKDTPKPIQEAVFSAMFDKEGFTPWGAAAGGPMTSSKIAEAQSAMANTKDKVTWEPAPWVKKLKEKAQSAIMANANAAIGAHNATSIPSLLEKLAEEKDRARLRSGPYDAIGAPGVKMNSRGQPYSSSLETITDKEKANVAASMQTIRMATSAGKPWWGGARGGTTNTNDLDINGGVHIHTAATDAAGIAKTIAPEIEKNMQVAPFNTGLEY